MRYRLRTLVIATALGPVLLALAWYLAIWFWNVMPSLVRQWGFSLVMLAILCAVGLAIFSVVSPPPGGDNHDRSTRWLALVVAGGQFFALWAAFWPMFELLGWLYVWGDNDNHWERDWVSLWSLLAAAFLAANVAVRGLMGLATRRYILVVVVLSGAILIFFAPVYVELWLR